MQKQTLYKGNLKGDALKHYKWEGRRSSKKVKKTARTDRMFTKKQERMLNRIIKDNDIQLTYNKITSHAKKLRRKINPTAQQESEQRYKDSQTVSSFNRHAKGTRRSEPYVEGTGKLSNLLNLVFDKEQRYSHYDEETNTHNNDVVPQEVIDAERRLGMGDESTKGAITKAGEAVTDGAVKVRSFTRKLANGKAIKVRSFLRRIFK